MPRLLARPPANDWPAIPGFRILRLLDQGGMGVVYQARQESLDRLVALKVIRPDRRANPEAVKRFEREAKAAAKLTHPNVVRVHHAGRAGALHYLVMEYVEGIDLARLVGRHGPLPVPPAIDYLRQAALGLQHLLDCGLVHRDIKPSNLLLQTSSPIADCRFPIEMQPSGQSKIGIRKSAILKIVDLGLARHLHPGEDSSITQGGMVGTPDYIAPEQAENPQQVDIRSDLYSLGCTLYYLLTGRPPFPEGTMIHKLDLHRWGTPAPLDRLRSDVPPEMAVIAARLLAKKPADRFQTPAELAEVLQPLVGTAAAHSTTVIPPLARTRIDPRGTTQVRAAPLPVGDSGLWLRGHTSAITSVAFAPDGQRGLSASLDESIRLWDLATGTELRTFAGHPGGVTAVAFTADGQHILSAGRDRLLRLHDLNGLSRVLAGHKGEVHGLALAPDGRHAISAGQDQTVRLWDLRKGKEVRRIGGTVTERHWDAVLCVALASRGRQPPEQSTAFALSGGRDGTARLWDLDTGRQLRCFRGHHAAVMAVDLAADNRNALSAAGMTVRLWDITSGELFKTLAGHTLPVLAARFSADGQRIVSAGQDGSIRLWNPATGEETQRFEGHAGWVPALAFSKDGRHVLFGTADGSVCLWPVRSEPLP